MEDIVSEYHIPVLYRECIDNLVIDKNGVYLDCTLGGGGHSEGILKELSEKGHLISIDQDQQAIDFAKKRLEKYRKKWQVFKNNFEKIKEKPIELAIEFAKKYNVILLLKGSTTIVTDGDETFLVKRGCAGMATAGSGDVLSGILVGILGYNEPSIKIVAAGAYLAGVSGELAQEKYTDISMKASDTIEMIPEAIKKIRCNNE